MQVEGIKDVTTKESAITYEIRIRISPSRDTKQSIVTFAQELAAISIRAINGIDKYGVYKQ
jgi:hypothetical protein